MPETYHNPDRSLLRISGADRVAFLEGLVSNAVSGVEKGAVYTALLSPKGKYLFDFIMTNDNDSILLDVKSNRAAPLAQRLNMYRLRADVQITDADLQVLQGFEGPPLGAFIDPRLPELGWRMYRPSRDAASFPYAQWDALRVAHCVPETGIELVPEETYILETGFERLNGVDFKKGCYVGQEITARMKHKTELKKGLVRVAISGNAQIGTPITVEGKPAGTLFSISGAHALAHLRFARAGGDMQAGDAVLRRV
ncbi:MAG: folate-binding protein [Paracoccaceae bacterium]